MGNDDRVIRAEHDLRQAEQTGDDLRKAELRETLGDWYIESDNCEEALVYLEKLQHSPFWQKSFLPADKARVWCKIASAQTGLNQYTTALQSLERAEREIKGIAKHPMLGKIYSLTGQAQRNLGNHQEALQFSLQALYALRDSRENEEIGRVQLTIGSLFLRQGDFAQALSYFHDSLATYRRIDDRRGIAKAYNNLGVAYKNNCQWDNATSCLRQAMNLDEGSNYGGFALRLLNLSLIQYRRGEWRGAIEGTDRALRMYRNIGDNLGIARCNLALARIARHRLQWDEAKSYAVEALELATKGESRREIAAAFEELGAWQFDRGSEKKAREFFEKSLAVAKEISERNDHVAEVHRRLAECAIAEGDPERGIEYAKHGLHVAIAIRDKVAVGTALRALSRAHREAGDAKRAVRFAGRSAKLMERIGVPFELGRSLLELATAALLVTDYRSARSSLTRAEAIFRRFHTDTLSCRVLIEFARLKIHSDRLEDAVVCLQKAEGFLEEGRITIERAEVDHLLREIEHSYVEGALSRESNRFLIKATARRANGSSLREIAESLDADRVFVFEGVAGEWMVRQTWKIENDDAARILERREWNWEDGRPARPIVSLSREGSISSLAVPINSEGTAGVYVERAIDSNRGHFDRRDLNFVVALVREWDLKAHKVQKTSSEHFGRIITQNPKMQEILETLEKLQGMHLTILLQGETGTGKGLFASEISKGNPGPFVTINCADLSESVLESELFGHVKSAFTGATAGKKGLFETADGGTVFIDEIDKTSRKFQEKLLRVVDRQEFKPVGSVRVKRVDCRIVCASNRNLGEAVKGGEFLADLYYRLKVISLLIPPLRERPEDILLLADHFLRRFAEQFEKPGIRLSEASLSLLAKHNWPGNVRDLQNEMERAVALASPDERIDPEDLSEELHARVDETPMSVDVGERTLAEMVGSLEKRVIDQVLRECVGNKSKTSRVLGLTRKGLRNKIQRYGIQEP